MRGHIDLVAWRDGGPAPDSGAPALVAADPAARRDDPYTAAKAAATAWLYATHRDILAQPRAHADQVEQAIAHAVRQAPLGPEASRRLRAELRADILGAGPLQPYLDDPTVTDILGVGRMVWVVRDGVTEPATTLDSDEAAYRLAEDLAQKAGYRFQRARPLLNFAWPDGARVNLVHPAVSPRGACFSIRKPDRSRSLDLDDLVRTGALSAPMAAFLTAVAQGRLNLCIAGSTGAGKTTTLRAIAHAVLQRATERAVVVEDTEELRLRHPHTVSLVALDTGEGHAVTVRDLLINALRMRPDRLIIGEVRDAEAIATLEAAKAEHGGVLFTMHLNGPEDLADRLYLIAQQHGMPIGWEAMRRHAHGAIAVLVQLDQLPDGRRRVVEIVELLPDGIAPLFVWDPDTDTHRAVGTLSPRRQAWLKRNGVTLAVADPIS